MRMVYVMDNMDNSLDNSRISKDIINFPIGTKQSRGKIIPIFIPFAGCPYQCIYCSQEKQSGAGDISVTNAIKRGISLISEHIKNHGSSEKVLELAFYGGTFTALTETDFNACLNFFKNMKKKLHDKSIMLLGRCSTRPDCLDIARLAQLKDCGIDLIELGIQSFDTKCLQKSGRNYTGQMAQKACETVINTRLSLGIQLMPSLPGQENKGGAIFINDMQMALSYKPACIRLYPCLVPEGTGLAELYKKGKYSPWNDEYCYDHVSQALAMAWDAYTAVIRLGVAKEDNFEELILAGTRHDAFGAIVQAKALLLAYDNTIVRTDFYDKNHASQQNIILTLPHTCQGYIFGQKNILKTQWENRLPLENIRYYKDIDTCSQKNTLFATLSKKG